MKHPVGHTSNGLPVTVDLIRSPVARQVARQPQLLTYAQKIVKSRAFEAPVVTIECDMGQTVGYCPVVPTANDDVIFYAQLVRETVYTRFTKKNDPKPTQFVTLVMHRVEDSYEIEHIYVGHFYPPRPGSPEETNESRSYWEKHAMVYDNQPIQPRSVTKVAPY